MVFFVGVVAPPASVVTPEGYELSALERRDVSLQLRGKPITVQHRQIRERIADMDARGLSLENVNLRCAVPHVGVVYASFEHDGWLWAIFSVSDECLLVLALIRAGHLLCLSLTHVVSRDGICPVELTLCSVPARPFSYIYRESASLVEAFAYKARILANTIPYKMEVQPAAANDAPTSKLSTILSKLDPADRVLIEARFSEMMASADSASVSQQKTLDRLNKLIEIKDVDKKMFATHFDYLLSQMPPAVQSKYAVNTETRSVLTEAPPEVLHHVGQLIKCASAAMASSTNSQHENADVPSPPKRARVEPDVEVANGSVLGRALADTFRI
jgi:hypothetical protein